MSILTGSEAPATAPHIADSHDMIRVYGA